MKQVRSKIDPDLYSKRYKLLMDMSESKPRLHIRRELIRLVRDTVSLAVHRPALYEVFQSLFLVNVVYHVDDSYIRIP